MKACGSPVRAERNGHPFGNSIAIRGDATGGIEKSDRCPAKVVEDLDVTSLPPILIPDLKVKPHAPTAWRSASNALHSTTQHGGARKHQYL